MLSLHTISRVVIAATLLIVITGTHSPTAYARARLIAVITFRSTPAARHDALVASRAVASRLAQEPGWDAIAIDAGSKNPADAAASAGAEVYVIGQYFPGSPARVVGASFRVATDERLTDFTITLSDRRTVPASIGFAQLIGAPVTTNQSFRAPTKVLSQPLTTSIPSGDLISVMILKDIGSRISQEGDTFAVETVEDYYYKGQLILPKGSPGYGVITHLKRAGSFHAGGELNFTVKRLVTPAKTDILVETNGATADADKVTEHNGNAFGQYLLWGVGMFAKRGNDILIKKGTTFHVSTLQNDGVPISLPNAQPAVLDPSYAISSAQQYAPGAEPAASLATAAPPTAALPAASDSSIIAPPLNWRQQQKRSQTPNITTLGYWASPTSSDENLEVVAQEVPTGMQPSEFANLTLRNLQNAIGANNVRAFRDERICNGNANGWYIESAVTIGITPVIAEQTLGLSGSDSYVATYRRPATSQEDPAARQALDTLCPRS